MYVWQYLLVDSSYSLKNPTLLGEGEEEEEDEDDDDDDDDDDEGRAKRTRDILPSGVRVVPRYTRLQRRVCAARG